MPSGSSTVSTSPLIREIWAEATSSASVVIIVTLTLVVVEGEREISSLSKPMLIAPSIGWIVIETPISLVTACCKSDEEISAKDEEISAKIVPLISPSFAVAAKIVFETCSNSVVAF